MRRILIGWLLVVAGACGQPSLLDLVMPDAQTLMGVRVERLRNSPLAQSLWAGMRAQQPYLAALIQATGFDPLRGLEEVLVASPGGSAKQNALLLMRGSFRAADWIEQARSWGAGVEVFQGVQIATAAKDAEPMSLAFPGESLLIAGDPASVRGAIARRERPAGLSAELRQKAAELAAESDLWFISSAPIRELGAAVSNPQVTGLLEGDVVKAIEQVTGGVRLAKGFHLALRTVSRTEQDAARLANAVRFFLGFVQAPQPSGPVLLPDLQQDGRHLSLSLTMPASDVERVLRAVRERSEVARPKPTQPAESGITGTSSPSDTGPVKTPEPKPQ